MSSHVLLSRRLLELELDPVDVNPDTGGSVRPCLGYIFKVLYIFFAKGINVYSWYLENTNNQPEEKHLKPSNYCLIQGKGVIKCWTCEDRLQRSPHGQHHCPLWLQCMFYKKEVQLAFEGVFSRFSHWLNSSLECLWDEVERAVYHLDGLLFHHRAWATGHLWGWGWHNQNTQRSIQITGWIFHMGHLPGSQGSQQDSRPCPYS